MVVERHVEGAAPGLVGDAEHVERFCRSYLHWLHVKFGRGLTKLPIGFVL